MIPEMSHAIQALSRPSISADVFLTGRVEPTQFWWGEAPEQLYDFREAAGVLSPIIWLRQYARRAAVYRVTWLRALYGAMQVTISRKSRD